MSHSSFIPYLGDIRKPWGQNSPINNTPFIHLNIPYPNTCHWNTSYNGQTYLRCPSYQFSVPKPVSDPTTCAQLFSSNQNVPPVCCGAFGIGCTPGANAPISFQGMRNY